ncbi:hypothetical protein V6N11_074547 [Hibiscus sabdariffa]|uniref:Uncharacterized protein n=1 Tax=Hibiscus sabdariffa TaxID=183260 RepID=A0ABR2R4K0_9ROSI
MGSRCKKALVAESVRESLHSWCKRVKVKSKRESVHSHTARSMCSLESIVDDEREAVTVGTLSRSSSMESLNQITITSSEQAAIVLGTRNTTQQGDISSISASQTLTINEKGENEGIPEEAKI